MPSPAEAQAAALWNAGSRAQSLTVLQQELRTEPENLSLLLAAGRVCLGLLRFDEADGYFQKALEAAGGAPSTRFHIARLLLTMSRQAAKAFAVLEAPLDPGAAVSPEDGALTLEILDRLGRENEALTLAESWRERAGFAVNPSFLLISSRLQGRRDPASALVPLERISGLARAGGDPSVAIRAAYEMARIEDRLGRHAQAWESVRKAHLLYQRGLPQPPRPQSMTEHLRRIRSQLLLLPRGEKNRAPDKTDRPGFPGIVLLAGFPRSGTTLAQRLLSENIPGLPVSDERNCMGLALQSLGLPPVPPPGTTPAKLRELAGSYYSSVRGMLEKNPERLLLDKCPGSTHLLPAYAMSLPGLRVLWPLRDPRDILVSCLTVYLPPNATTPAFLDPAALADLILASYECWWAVRERLEFPWLEFRYEDLVKDPETEGSRIAAFAMAHLNLPTGKNPEPAAPQALSPSYAEARQPVHANSLRRWTAYSQPLEQAFRILSPLVRKLGYD